MKIDEWWWMYESNMNMEILWNIGISWRNARNPQCEWEATAGKRVYLPGEAGVIISGIEYRQYRQLLGSTNSMSFWMQTYITCTQQNLMAKSTSSHHLIRRQPRLRQEELDTAAVRITGKLLPCLILSSAMEPTWPGRNDIMHWREGRGPPRSPFCWIMPRPKKPVSCRPERVCLRISHLSKFT